MGQPEIQRTINFTMVPQQDQAQNPNEGVTNQSLQPQPGPPIQRTGFQRPGVDDSGFYINTELPGVLRLFKRTSEKTFQKELELEFNRTGQRIAFPPEPQVSNEPYQPRVFASIVREVTPSVVCHGRVFFEQPNFDRHGWELGYLQPFISGGVFLYDVVLFPYHSWTDPCDVFECSAGKCLPGDRTPLYWYREKLSFTGLVGQSLAIGTGLVMFP